MPDTGTRSTNHISKLGYVVLIMAMISMCVVLWTSYEDRKQTQCQTNLNAQFMASLKQGRNLAEGDREAVRTLVKSLVNADTEKETQAALIAYDSANKALDKQRERLVYPSALSCQ